MQYIHYVLARGHISDGKIEQRVWSAQHNEFEEI
jgi:hypothetical protein